MTVNYSGTASGSVTTQSNGSYAISGLNNGSYTLTPARSGYTFSPASQNVSVSGANRTGINFSATAQSTDTELFSGVPVNSSVGLKAWKYFYITVPSGASQLEFKTTNASADVDLYTRQGSKPTSTTYTCRPYSSSGNETCTQNNPTAGTWWAGVHGYAAGSFTITATVTTPQATYTISGTVTSGGSGLSGVSVALSGAASAGATTNSSGAYSFSGLSDGSYTVTPSRSGYTFTPTSQSVTVSGSNRGGINFTGATSGGGDTQLSNGVAHNDSMTATTRQTSWKYYYFDLDTGDSDLSVLLSNQSNDLDLYVRQGAKPTTTTYDCRPYKGGSVDESCSFATPATGTWWVGINNWDTGSGMSYTVTAAWTEGGGGGGCAGAQTATYNAGFGAPACTTSGTGCDAPASLLQNAGNDEANQPNTVDTCVDGTSGSPQSDESIDSLKIETTDGTCLAPGKQVKVDFTAYLYGNGTSDYVAVYYASDASNPNWQLMGSTQGASGGTQAYSINFTLSGNPGSTQAVRAQIRYNSATNNACSGGSYDDHDDLVFKTE